MSNTELGAINSAPTGGVTPVENATYQTYTYSITATQSQEYLSLLFRNDPGFTWLDTVSVVADDDATNTNILTDGGFDDGPQPDSVVPVGWTTIGGAALESGGTIATANSGGDVYGVPHDGTYFWVDGAIDGYDGLAQQMTLTTGASYTLTFDLAVNPDGGAIDTDGPNAGIDTQVWVGSTVATAAACFLAGTRIATARGEVAVEALIEGENVVTQGGRGDIMKPIVWIGRSPFDAHRHPKPEQVLPVRIRAGGIGENVPRRDLLVSPGHALLIEGALFQAERLVNGATIIRDQATRRGTYFHVELADHDILLSEGAPSESYLDTGNRSAFVNAGQFVALHPDFSPRHWTGTCARLVRDGPELLSARQRLIDRAAALGWTRHAVPTPRLLVDGVDIAPIWRDGKLWRYTVPADATSIRLRSPAGLPSELLADSKDRRMLGMQVDGLAVIKRGVRRQVQMDDPDLLDGWHGVERKGQASWRWTDGDAGIAVFEGGDLEICVSRCCPVWHEPERQSGHLVAG